MMNIMLDSFSHLGYVLYEVKLTTRRRIMLKGKIILLVLILILLPIYALSQTEEIKDYTVIKGDTLWDISGKELSDPFLWPKVWKENPEIRNPDRIYPEQSIRIPLYLLRQEERAPEPVAEAVVQEAPTPVKAEEPKPVTPPKPKYIVNRELLMASGYVADSVKGVGRITGSSLGRSIFGNNDLMFVKMHEPVSEGDRFYVLQMGKAVLHPKTGKKMGYLIDVRGIAEIVKFEYGQTIARVVTSFKEIETGDLLDRYYEMTPPLVSSTYRKPDVEGYVVAARHMKLLNSMFDIVYIDRGTSAGIEPGDVLRVLEEKQQAYTKEKQLSPVGVIQVLQVNDNTATAVVRSGSGPVTTGNLLAKEE